MPSVPYFKKAAPSRQPLLTRKEVAQLLGVSVSCMEKWAELGTGPIFYRRGFSVHSHTAYRIEDVEQFFRDSYGDDLLATIAT